MMAEFEKTAMSTKVTVVAATTAERYRHHSVEAPARNHMARLTIEILVDKAPVRKRHVIKVLYYISCNLWPSWFPESFDVLGIRSLAETQ